MNNMRQANLSGVDLNLLVAFDAMLRTRSVTAAAREIGLSQPAMSRALGRIRDLFDDALFIRSRHAMVPTPRALELASRVATSLEAIRRTLEPPADFDPRTARRRFVIGAVDTTQTVIMPRLLEHMGHVSPHIEVSTAPIRSTEETLEQLASGERDIAVGRFESPPDGIRAVPLYRDRIVCLVRRDHPRIRARLTMKRYLAEAHIAAESASPVERPFTIESILAAQGLSRRVACTVQNLAMAPLIVARTDLIATAPEVTIRPFAEGLGLRIFDPPFSASSFELQLTWHERNDRDGGHRWLRESMLTLFSDQRDG